MILTGAAYDSEVDSALAGRQRGRAQRYLAAVGVASVLAVLFALAGHLERLLPGQPLMSAEAFGQLALLRDALFALALALPTVTALAHLTLPAPLPGSPGERLERLVAGAHLGGGAVLLASTVTSGWTCLVLVAIAGVLVGSGGLMQGFAVLGRLRAPRPAGGRPTMLARALGVTALAQLLTLPVAIALFALLATERLTHTPLWHDAGSNPLVFEHWLRLVLQPLAYLALVPCLGAVADVLGCRGRALTVASAVLLLFGAIAAGGMVLGDGAPGGVAVRSCFALLLLVPLTVIAGNLVSEARLDGSAAAWFALAFMVALVELAATGLPLALADVGQTLAEGAFAAAHRELLIVALAFALAAALHRAWPRLALGQVHEGLARLGGALAFVGLQLTAGAQLFAGRAGMPVTFEYAAEFRALAAVATSGWVLAAVGAAVVAVNLAAAVRRR